MRSRNSGRVIHLGELEDDILRGALLGHVDVVEKDHRAVAGDAPVLGWRVDFEQVGTRRDRLVWRRSPADIAEYRLGRNRTW